MAVSLSTNLSSACTPHPSPPRRLSNSPSQHHHHHQIKTLAAPATALQHHYRPNNLILRSNTPNLFGNLYSSRCRPSLAFKKFTPQGYGSPRDARTPGSSVERRQKLSLKSLFNVYKEAILYRDLETMSEVEAVISSFENEKNELLQKVENEKNELLLKVENEKNELLQKLADMSSEISSGKEKFIRLQADFDNFRKRSEKERLAIRSDAQGEVFESILPMVDSFERAKQQIKPETERETRIDSSYQGIYKQFVEIMRSLRVAAVPTVGKPFDPSMHEAIAREESLEFKEGIVIQELRRGFLLGSRLLRPAMVKVSSGPGKIKVADRSSAASAGLDER